MSAAVQSIIHAGSESIIVDVECHISNGLPAIVIVGLGGKSVDEAKERIRGAYANSRISMPRQRITINLAPADIPKESTCLDLAIALAVMQANKQIPETFTKKDAVVGELGLDSSVKPVRGVIGKLLAAKKEGVERFFVPEKNLEQALLVPDIRIIPVNSLRELYLALNGQKKLAEHHTSSGKTLRALHPKLQNHSMSAVVGQAQAKRALEIVASGGHNILLNGPPGTGKSMLAKALPSILPALTLDEVLEVTHLHSLTNDNCEELITTRPFRAPHYSASHVAIIGGGHTLRPGEISLSHRGVLFFDELPEFSRLSIEALRQPLEDRTITIARAKHSTTYPANFIFVATANPCPCGFYNTTKPCRCSAYQIHHYQQKISGPIMDRIDLYVNVEQINHDLLFKPNVTEEYDEIVRARVKVARAWQQKRYGTDSKLNANMTNNDAKHLAMLLPPARKILNDAARQLDLSMRSYLRVIKVARTIADLENSAAIETEHLAEALQYRASNIQTL